MVSLRANNITTEKVIGNTAVVNEILSQSVDTTNINAVFADVYDLKVTP